MRKQIIAVDLGGTQIRTARFDSKLNLLQRENTLTLADEGLGPTLARIREYIYKVMPDSRDDILGIGVSSPGPLNPISGVIVAPPNLKGWHQVPLAEIIQAEFGLPVFIGNDANAAALAEASKGAAQGHRHVVYITVSTGIGGGIICDGRLLLGQEGLGGELGHIPIIADGGRVSSLELEAAGPAIARRMKRRIQRGEQSLVAQLADGDLGNIDAKVVGQAAARGDRAAVEEIAYAGRMIGLGIVTALHLFNPEIVVLGGGVTKTGDLLFQPMRQAIGNHVLDASYTARLKIKAAALGGDAALAGAAALVATKGGHIDISDLDRRF